jgi:putative ABC transport system permease protein
VTAALRERPAPMSDGDGGAPARRAVVRWALRLFRREWRRQAVVLALLVVAVATMILSLGAVTSAAGLKADSTYGTADTIVSVAGSDPAVSADVAALRQRFGAVEVITHQSVPIPGSVSNLDVRAEDPHGPFGHVMLRLDSGRYPTGPDEVALSADAEQTFGVGIGSHWTENGRTEIVVGVIENPLNLLDQFALLAPGQANPPATISFLLDSGRRGPGDLRLPSHTSAGIATRGPASKTIVAAVVLVVCALGLVFVGLMSVAGFAVMAQRRLRALGMLGSLGATDRHLRLVMLANGAAVGVSAALAGTAAGLAAWFPLVPAFESLTAHRIDAFALPWWAIGAAAALTVATALLAAWWPARVVSRVSAIAALSGRPPRPAPAHRFATIGGLLLATGIVLLAFADQKRVGFILGGTVTTAVGMLLLAPLAIRLAAVLGRHSPISITLALRDLARYQARSGAALGAVTMAIGIASTIAISASATQPTHAAGNLPADELVLHTTAGGALDPVPVLSVAALNAATNAVEQLTGEIHATAPLVLDRVYDPDRSEQNAPPAAGSGRAGAVPGQPGSGGGSGGFDTAALAEITRTSRGESITSAVTLYVATPAVLAHYGVTADQIAADTDVISSRTDLDARQIFDPSLPAERSGGALPADVTRPVIQVSNELPDYTSDPGTLLSAHAMQVLGLQPTPAAWLLKTAHPLTTDEIAIARKIAAGAGLRVEARTRKASLAPLRNWSTAAGIVLALGVLAMTIGLIRSETANDLRTLAAAGASSRTRRALTAMTAGALALLGALVGTAGAYAALLAWHRSDLTPLGQVPVLDLVGILAGLPIIATAGGWLLAGREPAGMARRPLD